MSNKWIPTNRRYATKSNALNKTVNNFCVLEENDVLEVQPNHPLKKKPQKL